MRSAETTSVLVVGAGPVGLTLSLLLSGYGVEHLVVEAREGTSAHPKARGVSARSMEVFRRLGVEADVRRAGLPASHVFFYRGRDLVDPDFTRTGVTGPPAGEGGAQGGVERTPSPGLICSQDALEAVLLRHGRERAPGRVRFATRLLSFTEEADGVRAVLEDRAGGARRTVRAGLLVGCDGAASTVRAGAGIAMEGPTGLGHFLSIRFEAPLGAVVADRASASYFLTAPGRGGFLAVDNDRHWIYQHPCDPRDGDLARLRDDHRELARLVREAAGLPGLEVTVRDTMTWRMDARLAASYRRSRVLLAGDAAHVVPPTGGHGMNTGIGDADNLAWKLAAVVHGPAGERLLDTYQDERRPLARQVIDLSLANSRARAGYRIDDELLLTARYRSAAVVDGGDDGGGGGHQGGAPLDPACGRWDGGPGARLPHLRLGPGAGAASTLDLVGPGFALLTPAGGDVGAAWRRQADTASAAGLPVALRPLPAGAGALGVAAGGALLVRPDGHLAWQAPRPPADDTHLLAVLRRILAAPAPR
ncbi:FAD-dependent monooxygenase [Kitasatospora sp. NPDC093806]|uniref:FAD-dependent monooxygenase n=1 Tax=Kitasatospora sp. NPDC093806 TaxID=3155075 RepID=UPI0034367812